MAVHAIAPTAIHDRVFPGRNIATSRYALITPRRQRPTRPVLPNVSASPPNSLLVRGTSQPHSFGVTGLSFVLLSCVADNRGGADDRGGGARGARRSDGSVLARDAAANHRVMTRAVREQDR